MKRCPSCHTDYGTDAQFCTKDGARLMAAGDPAPNVCAAAPHAAAGGEMPTDSAMVGRVLDGRYLVEKKVGEGGMSFVYLATELGTRQPRAIKILSAALSQDSSAMAQLKRQAGLGMRLAHPNVCHIIRVGETEDGLVYVVMPFVEGELLSDRNNRVGHVPLDETVRLVQGMAAGLHVAHELNIVHRDLKPENVMVYERPDGTEWPVVMDFGRAKGRRAGPELQRLTATGVIMGTAEFMGPEQLRGKPLDARTDIYSLSLLTYEMLTSRLPFQGPTPQELMISRLRSDPIPLRKMRPDLDFPEAVERVFNEAMARNPDERPGTTLDLANGLAAGAGDGRGVGPMGQGFGR